MKGLKKRISELPTMAQLLTMLTFASHQFLYGLTFSLFIIGFAQFKLQSEEAQATFWQALSTAQSIQSRTLMQGALAGFIWLYLEQGQPAYAAELTALIEWDDAQLWLAGLFPRLESTLGAADLEMAIERGKSLDLDTIVQTILSKQQKVFTKRDPD
ncbi:MAG: hypothetical protein AAF485_24245 [Chloroflexota bacterium]